MKVSVMIGITLIALLFWAAVIQRVRQETDFDEFRDMLRYSDRTVIEREHRTIQKIVESAEE